MQAYLNSLKRIKSTNSIRNPGYRKATHRIDNGESKRAVWGRSYAGDPK